VTGFLGNLPQEHVIRTLQLFASEVRPRCERLLEPPQKEPPKGVRPLPPSMQGE
jgi:hypothetical protein